MVFIYKIYQVEYGDTLDSISKKFNTNPNDLKKINSIKSDSDLIVGSLIIVPKNENSIFDAYIVKQGESIYSIARSNNVDLDTLLLINGLGKNDIIYPNQEIIIPKNDIIVYVTKDGDTLNSIIDNLGVDANTLNLENERLFLLNDQLIVHKKENK